MAEHTILVVDDNPTLVKVLQRFLADFGFDTLVATTGAEARLALETKSIALVLLDIGLPDCDGLDLLADIRKRVLSVPVIVMTAHATSENREKAAELKIHAFLSKPFSLAHLRRTLEEVALAT